MPIDLSLITTCHREGALCQTSFRSFQMAINNARDSGLQVELIVVLDRPDSATRDSALTLAMDEVRIYDTDYGDPGLARNHGVRYSNGEFLSIIDGDDLISPNWLTRARSFAINCPQPVICHPGIEIYFGEKTMMRVAYDSDAPDFSHDCLLEETGWPVTALASREIYLNHPFKCRNEEAGFAHEDSQWNCDTIAAGILHKLVPQTMFCYRIKPSNLSLNSLSRRENHLMGASPLFQLPFQARAR